MIDGEDGDLYELDYQDLRVKRLNARRTVGLPGAPMHPRVSRRSNEDQADWLSLCASEPPLTDGEMLDQLLHPPF